MKDGAKMINKSKYVELLKQLTEFKKTAEAYGPIYQSALDEYENLQDNLQNIKEMFIDGIINEVMDYVTSKKLRNYCNVCM